MMGGGTTGELHAAPEHDAGLQPEHAGLQPGSVGTAHRPLHEMSFHSYVPLPRL